MDSLDSSSSSLTPSSLISLDTKKFINDLYNLEKTHVLRNSSTGCPKYDNLSPVRDVVPHDHFDGLRFEFNRMVHHSEDELYQNNFVFNHGSKTDPNRFIFSTAYFKGQHSLRASLCNTGFFNGSYELNLKDKPLKPIFQFSSQIMPEMGSAFIFESSITPPDCNIALKVIPFMNAELNYCHALSDSLHAGSSIALVFAQGISQFSASIRNLISQSSVTLFGSATTSSNGINEIRAISSYQRDFRNNHSHRLSTEFRITNEPTGPSQTGYNSVFTAGYDYAMSHSRIQGHMDSNRNIGLHVTSTFQSMPFVHFVLSIQGDLLNDDVKAGLGINLNN